MYIFLYSLFPFVYLHRLDREREIDSICVEWQSVNKDICLIYNNVELLQESDKMRMDLFVILNEKLSTCLNIGYSINPTLSLEDFQLNLTKVKVVMNKYII